jgi:starvation-inducible DNA-binding protein
MKDGSAMKAGALDVVCAQVSQARRQAIEAAEDLGLVTQSLLVRQSGQLGHFRWFVRAHLERDDGSLTAGNAGTELSAAQRAPRK